jgi:hypothetical protein
VLTKPPVRPNKQPVLKVHGRHEYKDPCNNGKWGQSALLHTQLCRLQDSLDDRRSNPTCQSGSNNALC